MARLSAAQSAVVQLLGNMCLTKGVLAINAASAATIKTTNALVYTVDGVLYSKAALSAQALTVISGGTAFYVQPVSSTVYYVVAVNAAGTVITVQGDFTGRDLSIPYVGRGDGFVPDVPAGYTAIGMFKVVTNGSTTFTPATTALDAAGVTVTYYDIGVLPATKAP